MCRLAACYYGNLCSIPGWLLVLCCLLSYFIDLYRMLVGCSAGWRAGWVTELLGLLGLLESVIAFLALLEGGSNHVVYLDRRLERSADLR